MRKALLSLLAALAATAVFAQESREPLRLTLEEVIEYAVDNSYGRESVRLNESKQTNVYDQSKLNRLPDLNFKASEGFSNSNAQGTSWNGNYDLSAGITIFQGGQINNTIEQNRLQLEQTKLRTQQYDNELTIQILQSFLTALGNEELLKYQQSVLKASEEQVTQGRERFAVGDILESDYLLLEAQYAADANNVVETQINIDNNLVALKSLMSMDLSQPIELIYPDTESIEEMLALPSRSDVLERSMENMPDIQISSYNVEIAETGLRITKSSYYPTLAANASIGTGHANDFKNYGTQLSDRFNQQVGLTLSIPIFNRNQTRSNVNQSKINLRQAELDDMQNRISVEQTLLSEYGNVVAAGSKYKTSETRQNAYLRSFEAYTEMFNAGSITTVELLQQQNNYISTVNDYIQSKYNFMLRRKILDVYMGEYIKM